MSTNLIQVSINTVSPGNHLALSRILILMYFQKVLVFSDKLRVIMQMFVHFQEKRPFSQLTFAKNMGKIGMLVEEFYLRSTLNTSASKFKWGWWTYFPCIVLVHLEVMFKMSGDFLLSMWKVRQHFHLSANIRISWFEVVVWELMLTSRTWTSAQNWAN